MEHLSNYLLLYFITRFNAVMMTLTCKYDNIVCFFVQCMNLLSISNISTCHQCFATVSGISRVRNLNPQVKHRCNCEYPTWIYKFVIKKMLAVLVFVFYNDPSSHSLMLQDQKQISNVIYLEYCTVFQKINIIHIIQISRNNSKFI